MSQPLFNDEPGQITEQATVVDVLPGEIVVAVVRTSACGACKARQGCGQAVLSEWGSADKQQAKNHFRIPFTGKCSPGDVVELGMAHDAVSKVAMLVYLLPLALAFSAMLFGRFIGGSELLQLGLFVVMLIVSFGLISRFQLLKTDRLEPKILQLYRRGKGADLIVSTASESV